MPMEAIVQGSVEAVEIIDTPIPIPGDSEVVIKVVVAGTNPKDWKLPLWKNVSLNSGDDLAGIVHSVGKDVYEFKPGDRVGALHEYGKKNGGFAEYAVAPDRTTFHLAPNVSFEEAATVPLAAFTASIMVYLDLKFPLFNSTPNSREKLPLVIYGVTSAVGAFAAKLARLSGARPIIGIAGRSKDFANTLADYVVDYRQGEDSVVAAVEEILTKEGLGSKAPYVIDAISEDGTIETALRFLDPKGGIITTALPAKLFARDKENFQFPPGVRVYSSAVIQIHTTDKDFGYIFSRYIGKLMGERRFTGHPYKVIPGGLKGVLTGLQKLRDGKASGTKYVYRIKETGSIPSFPFRVGQPASSEPTQKAPHSLQHFPFPEV